MTLSLATIQFREVQLDDLSKNMAFFKNCCKKSQFAEKKAIVFVQNGFKMLKKPFYFWQNVVFTDETRVRISSDEIVGVFWRNGTRFFEKKTQKFEFRQTMTYDLVCNTIRWTEIAC